LSHPQLMHLVAQNTA